MAVSWPYAKLVLSGLQSHDGRGRHDDYTRY